MHSVALPKAHVTKQWEYGAQKGQTAEEKLCECAYTPLVHHRIGWIDLYK